MRKRAPSREEAIESTLRFMKKLLKDRGDDPSKYNKKYLMDKATEAADGYFKLHGHYGIEIWEPSNLTQAEGKKNE